MKNQEDIICHAPVKITLPWEKVLLKMEANMKEGLLKGGYSTAYALRLSRQIRKSGINLFASYFAWQGTVTLQQQPLGSLGASGKMELPDAGVIVYVRGTVKRSAHTRKWVMPRDPKTPAQLLQREQMKMANAAWHQESAIIREAWNQAAKKASSQTGYSLYIHTWFKKVKSGQNPPPTGLLP
jgi:hypothetical protein